MRGKRSARTESGSAENEALDRWMSAENGALEE